MAELKPFEVIMLISPIAGQNGKGEVVMKAEKVAELVRCKDCKYHEDEELGMVWCPYFIGSWVENDFYCAIGERMDEVEE